MRRARILALFLDVLVCAVPADLAGLTLTWILWRFIPSARTSIPAVWIGAALAATAAFLLRDARAGRARRWLGLEVRAADGSAPGAWRSIRRNLPLLVPLWNLWDAWPFLRDGEASRRSDRRGDLRMVRIT
jgi:hypothetical protein